MKFDSIIWDWNGTLLNDVRIAVDSINHLLHDRDLELLTIERYLDVFTFPVQNYYELIGFDLKTEPFEIPAFQFISIYNKAVKDCGLHDEVVPLLSRLRGMGYRQFILSAMEQQVLEQTVTDNDIHHFFEDLCGLSDNFAVSKVANGKSLIYKRGLDPERTLMVGDTIHDYEVAQAIGCKCVLIAKGHQSKERLLTTGAHVLDG
ncbi:MAG TPA: HAD family hydrolase, partial [Prolixibacteraceae bacterium]|nr:HAD family hydrolase [Prolixibacteraceae bacterium]